MAAESALSIDSRLLGRPPSFDGKEEQWAEWQFQARAYLDTIDPNVPQALDRAEAATKPIHMSVLNELGQNVTRKIFLVLTVLLKGPPSWS